MECIFCRIIHKEIPSEVLLETQELLAFKDIHPAAPVHVLIVPKRHLETVNDLTAEDATLLAQMVLAAKELAQKSGITESGYRLVMNCNQDGGQEVFHLHLHLLGGKPLGGMVSRKELP